jgi:class 3 adenylate cyclase
VLGDEAVHSLMGRFFEMADGAIESFGGTIDKHIGDCVMAVFGAPVAHSNDSERAIRAALAIRERMPALSEAARPVAPGARRNREWARASPSRSGPCACSASDRRGSGSGQV